MIIEERYRERIAFIEQDRAEHPAGPKRRKPGATAFVVGIESRNTTALFAATAAHVIRECIASAQRCLAEGSVYLRHSKDGKAPGLEINLSQWKCHSTCDVAAALIAPDAKNYAGGYFSLNELATDEHVRRHEIAVGDQVFFLGMFSEIPSRTRIQPVTRFGKVSLLPDEPINVDVGTDLPSPVPAYLIEATSWPGFSGSPVLVDFSSGRKLQSGDERPMVIGVLHGAAMTDDATKPAHTGFAIVTPAQKLIDLLLELSKVPA
jgi:hypothetical protein